jgi:hypothetical protein
MSTATINRYLSDEQIEEFWQQGFLLLKGILDAETTEKARWAILDMVPRDLVFTDQHHMTQGRFKPYQPDGSQSFYTPELMPLLCNEKLYGALADLFETPYLSVSDASVGISIKDAGQPGRFQNLHLDMRVPNPEDLSLDKLRYGVGMGGCYYLTDVEENGAGIHVVPGGHRLAEEKMMQQENGTQLYKKWKAIDDFPPSVEILGQAGDFVLMHHMMPHGASRNKNPSPRVAQFTRHYRLSAEDAAQIDDIAADFSAEQLEALTPLGRKLFRLDPWT